MWYIQAKRAEKNTHMRILSSLLSLLLLFIFERKVLILSFKRCFVVVGVFWEHFSDTEIVEPYIVMFIEFYVDLKIHINTHQFSIYSSVEICLFKEHSKKIKKFRTIKRISLWAQVPSIKMAALKIVCARLFVCVFCLFAILMKCVFFFRFCWSLLVPSHMLMQFPLALQSPDRLHRWIS